MDPISQGALGAITAGSLAKEKTELRLAVLTGWAGGMLADADIFIRSETDPLLTIEYHRHFSHALLFIPVGGLVCAGLLWIVLCGRKKFLPLLLYSTVGYATAGLLDACTSYGTRLLWPFSDMRVAWNIISIVDPVFTLTILLLLAISVKRRAARWSRIACLFALGYLGLGVLQNARAARLQSELISSRGHDRGVSMETVRPSIGNLVLWRSVYRHGGMYHVDAVRLGFPGGRRVFEGVAVEALDLESLMRGVSKDSVLASDLERFEHFSAGYLARHPAQEDVVGDLRYAMVPNSVLPLWGIRYDPTQSDSHVKFEHFRDAGPERRRELLRMLFDSGDL